MMNDTEMRLPRRHVVSLSGGKDSTAMLLRMVEENQPIDEILFCDTGMEFSEMYDHLERLEKETGRNITRLKSPQSFEYYFSEHTPKRKNPSLMQCRGMSWPSPQIRWCTSALKTRLIDAYLRQYYRTTQSVLFCDGATGSSGKPMPCMQQTLYSQIKISDYRILFGGYGMDFVLGDKPPSGNYFVLGIYAYFDGWRIYC